MRRVKDNVVIPRTSIGTQNSGWVIRYDTAVEYMRLGNQYKQWLFYNLVFFLGEAKLLLGCLHFGAPHATLIKK